MEYEEARQDYLKLAELDHRDPTWAEKARAAKRKGSSTHYQVRARPRGVTHASLGGRNEPRRRYACVTPGGLRQPLPLSCSLSLSPPVCFARRAVSVGSGAANCLSGSWLRRKGVPGGSIIRGSTILLYIL
eukprot:436107-Prorocentrum_minimum.AAC.2